MRFSSLVLSLALVLGLVPTALALEGIGPRVTVTGIVQEIRISEQQRFDEVGGEIVIQAANGQIVTATLVKETEITAEGRLSRKLLLPENITTGMNIRVRGLRTSTQSLTASLVIILNIELNPVLAGNGVIQSIGGSSITVLSPDGVSRTLRLTNETEVNASYTVRGSAGLSLPGMNALYTLSPTDSTVIRILRITGVAEQPRTPKPPRSRATR